MGSVVGLDLGEDVGDVVADRLRAEHELAGDRLVVEPLGDEHEDVELAVGELRERPRRARPAGVGELADRLGERLVEHDVAGGDRAQGVLDALGPGPLDEVAAGAVAQRGERGVVVLRHRQHDDPHGGVVLGQPAVDLEAGGVGEPHVEQHDVRRGVGDEVGDLVGALGLADELDAVHLLDRRGEAHAEHRVVVDDRDPHRRRHGSAAGSWTCTRVPRGELASTCTRAAELGGPLAHRGEPDAVGVRARRSRRRRRRRR